MLANFFCGSIIKHFFEVQEKKKEVAALCSSPPKNVKLRSFTLWSGSDGNEMYKKGCKCVVVVLPILTYCFLPFSLLSPSPSSLLYKLPVSPDSMSLLAALYSATKLVWRCFLGQYFVFPADISTTPFARWSYLELRFHSHPDSVLNLF